VKIPGINQTGVPGAEQLSLGAISSAAQAKMRTTSTLTKVVDDYQAKVVKAETDEEFSRMSNGFTRDTGAAWEEIKAQAQVDGNGAPTYDQLMPQYEAAHDKILKDYNGRIKFNPNKAAFSQFADRTLTGNTNTVRGESSRRTVAHLSGAYQQSKIDLMNSANGLEEFSTIQESAVSTGLVSPGQAAVDYDSFQQEHHTNRIMSEFQSARDLGRGQEFLDSISGKSGPIDGSPQERNPNGLFPESFDEGEKQSVINTMRAELNRDEATLSAAKRSSDSSIKAQQKVLVDEAKRYQAQVDGGALLTNGFVETYTSMISGVADPVERADLERSLRWYADGQSILHSDTGHSLDDLVASRDSIKSMPVTTVDEGERRGALLKTLDLSIAQIEKDPQQAAIDMGILKPNQTTLSDAISSGDISGWLQESGTRKQMVDEYWGIDAEIMNSDDVETLGDHLDSPEGIQTLRSVVDTLGPSTETFLAKLYTKGYQSLAVIGDLMRQADSGSSVSYVLQGKSMMDSDADVTMYMPDKDLAGIDFDELVGVGTGNDSLFGDDWRYRGAIKTSISHAYVALSARAGDNSGAFDENRYEQAMASVIGNVFKRGDNIFGNGGYVIPSPRRNMDEGDTDDWVDSLPITTFEGIDPDLDAQQVHQEMIDGDIDLVWAGEQGAYLLDRNGHFIKKPDGSDFVLEYKD
tara:strand:- start:5513 stop:7588 length:2076 start_codon:yes stop_codon:yes gene_type:complete